MKHVLVCKRLLADFQNNKVNFRDDNNFKDDFDDVESTYNLYCSPQDNNVQSILLSSTAFPLTKMIHLINLVRHWD